MPMPLIPNNKTRQMAAMYQCDTAVKILVAKFLVVMEVMTELQVWTNVRIRDTRNMLSKMSFFVRPKSPISSKISSKCLIFVQISPAIERYLICKWNGQIRTNFQVCIKKCSISLYYGRLVSLKSSSAFNVCTNFVLCNQHVACTAQACSRLNRHRCASITPH